MKQLPLEMVQLIISYLPVEVKYKFYDKYKLYHWLKNVDQYVKLDFVRLECFNLLKHFGAPFSSFAIYLASYNGRLDMVKWLYVNGSDWHDRAFSAANARGHREVAEWLYQHAPTSVEMI